MESVISMIAFTHSNPTLVRRYEKRLGASGRRVVLKRLADSSAATLLCLGLEELAMYRVHGLEAAFWGSPIS